MVEPVSSAQALSGAASEWLYRAARRCRQDGRPLFLSACRARAAEMEAGGALLIITRLELTKRPLLHRPIVTIGNRDENHQKESLDPILMDRVALLKEGGYASSPGNFRFSQG